MRLVALLLALLAASCSSAEQRARPSPRSWLGQNCSASASAAAGCAASLLAKMNLTEKIAFLHGNDKCPPPQPEYCRGYTGYVVGNARLGIPPLQMNDGPQGFRDGNGGTTTSFPSGLAAAASWDVETMALWGSSMGAEFRAKGANVQLGPGLCVARLQHNGRNFEYLSGEDPHLGSVLVKPVITAIQSHGVIANAKHWVMNSQETDRMTIDEFVDERTRFEMYYPPFAAAVEAGVGSVMCSYNKINTFWSCENNVTLHELKNALGFRGWVMSDWEAAHSPLSIMRGLDQEMPGYGGAGPAMGTSKIRGGLANHTITLAAIDDAVRRQLTMMFRIGVMDAPPDAYDPKKLYANASTDASIAAARKVSAAATVLLKNEGALLPLKASSLKSIAVIGLADENAVIAGGGSGGVAPSWHGVATPLAGITAAAGGAKVTFADGHDSGAAVAAAKAADVAIVFVGAMSGEGADRKTLNLGEGLTKSKWRQDDLVAAVAAAQAKTIVVVATPGAILLPWSAAVPAILTNFMPGEQVGNAIADVLFGAVNPSGRLPLTFPNVDNETKVGPSQWPYTNKSHPEVHYSEKLLIGYRFYDENQINFTTGFPFGHGLSYTQFDYSALRVTRTGVSLTVANTGAVAGAEIVQLYLGFPATAGEPPRQLKGFRKVSLAAGARTSVTIPLSDRELSTWNVASHSWKVASGEFTVLVGASSRDIRLIGSLAVGGRAVAKRVGA